MIKTELRLGRCSCLTDFKLANEILCLSRYLEGVTHHLERVKFYLEGVTLHLEHQKHHLEGVSYHLEYQKHNLLQVSFIWVAFDLLVQTNYVVFY